MKLEGERLGGALDFYSRPWRILLCLPQEHCGWWLRFHLQFEPPRALGAEGIQPITSRLSLMIVCGCGVSTKDKDHPLSPAKLSESENSFAKCIVTGCLSDREVTEFKMSEKSNFSE